MLPPIDLFNTADFKNKFWRLDFEKNLNNSNLQTTSNGTVWNNLNLIEFKRKKNLKE